MKSPIHQKNKVYITCPFWFSDGTFNLRVCISFLGYNELVKFHVESNSLQQQKLLRLFLVSVDLSLKNPLIQNSRMVLFDIIGLYLLFLPTRMHFLFLFGADKSSKHEFIKYRGTYYLIPEG